MKFYTEDNVWDAALKRIRYIFENEENIYVSSSGGKDSTVVTELAIKVARDMGRLPVNVAFLDQESEYQSTVDYFRKLKQRPEVKLYWFQVPFNLGSNVTTGDQIYLHAWRPEEKDKWMRKQEPDSIHDYGPCNEGPDMRFHRCVDLMGDYIFGLDSRYMALLGLRADESLTRYSLMCKKSCVYKNIQWASRVNHRDNAYKCYPIYDWCTSDIWKAISTNHWSYNGAYDEMFKIGLSPNTMRVSSLIHETGVHELKILQRIEHKTWEKLSQRVYGLNTFKHLHSSDMYSMHKLPAFFSSWNEYRDYLLDKICTDEARAIFVKAFKHDWDTDDIKCLKAQVNTIIMNDVNLTKYNNYKVSKRLNDKKTKGAYDAA